MEKYFEDKDMIDFLSIVTVHLNILISDYEYKVKLFQTDPKNFGNSLVKLESPKVGINVTLDRGQVFIFLGSLNKPEDEWFDICDVINYYAPFLETVYVFPENLVGEESINFQVNRLADLTITFCKPILFGDFSKEEYIRAIKAKRVETFKKEMKKRFPQFKNID
jgi:hypothetical protein